MLSKKVLLSLATVLSFEVSASSYSFDVKLDGDEVRSLTTAGHDFGIIMAQIKGAKAGNYLEVFRLADLPLPAGELKTKFTKAKADLLTACQTDPYLYRNVFQSLMANGISPSMSNPLSLASCVVSFEFKSKEMTGQWKYYYNDPGSMYFYQFLPMQYKSLDPTTLPFVRELLAAEVLIKSLRDKYSRTLGRQIIKNAPLILADLALFVERNRGKAIEMYEAQKEKSDFAKQRLGECSMGAMQQYSSKYTGALKESERLKAIVFLEAVTDDLHKGEAQYRLAQIYLSAFSSEKPIDVSKAVTILNKLTRDSVLDEISYLTLADVELGIYNGEPSNVAKAQFFLDEAKKCGTPDYSTLLRRTAEIMLGFYDDREADVEGVIALALQSQGHHLDLTLVDIYLGRYGNKWINDKEAERVLTELFNSEKNDLFFHKMARFRYQKKEYETAFKLFKEMADKGNLLSRYYYARMLSNPRTGFFNQKKALALFRELYLYGIYDSKERYYKLLRSVYLKGEKETWKIDALREEFTQCLILSKFSVDEYIKRFGGKIFDYKKKDGTVESIYFEGCSPEELAAKAGPIAAAAITDSVVAGKAAAEEELQEPYVYTPFEKPIVIELSEGDDEDDEILEFATSDRNLTALVDKIRNKNIKGRNLKKVFKALGVTEEEQPSGSIRYTVPGNTEELGSHNFHYGNDDVPLEAKQVKPLKKALIKCFEDMCRAEIAADRAKEAAGSADVAAAAGSEAGA